MSKKTQKQMPLMPCDIEHPRANELGRISQILDAIPTITEMVLQDLTHCVKNRNRGAEGMSAEQVMRAAIIKQTEGFSCEWRCWTSWLSCQHLLSGAHLIGSNKPGDWGAGHGKQSLLNGQSQILLAEIALY